MDVVLQNTFNSFFEVIVYKFERVTPDRFENLVVSTNINITHADPIHFVFDLDEGLSDRSGGW